MKPKHEDRILAFYRTLPRNETLKPREIWDNERTWFDCPFSQEDHGAYIRNPVTAGNQFGDKIVYCPICDQHGWYSVGDFVTSMLEDEERRFRNIISKFEDIEEKSIEPEKACMMWHSQGLPEEMSFEITTDLPRLRELMAEHRAKSGNNFAGVYGGLSEQP